MKVLLLGAGGNAGMNFTKCMHRSGNIAVYGADTNPYYLAASNCDFKVNLDYSSEEAKLESLLNHCKKLEIDMIHAQPDPEVHFLLKYKEHLEHPTYPVSLIFPHSLETWKLFRDKEYCQRKWGFDVHNVRTLMLSNDGRKGGRHYEVFERLKEQGKGKVWVRARTGAGSRCALPVEKWEQVLNWIDYWKHAKQMHLGDFVIAPYLPGREYAVQTLWINGDIIHSQARERLIYFFGALMPSGQTSTPAVARTISEDAALIYNRAYRAIEQIDEKPNGIYCVDMKENAAGELVPMEVNYGRFFTTMDFFAALGLNTPLAYMLSQHYQYQKVPDKFRQTAGLLKHNMYWIRGLDREPVLCNEEMIKQYGPVHTEAQQD